MHTFVCLQSAAHARSRRLILCFWRSSTFAVPARHCLSKRQRARAESPNLPTESASQQHTPTSRAHRIAGEARMEQTEPAYVSNSQELARVGSRAGINAWGRPDACRSRTPLGLLRARCAGAHGIVTEHLISCFAIPLAHALDARASPTHTLKAPADVCLGNGCRGGENPKLEPCS